MKILVTGGMGLVGRPVVRRLVEHGHDVRVVDRQAGECSPGVECIPCDVTDFAQVREQARGMEGIIHLAAIPHPGGTPGSEIFRINATGTFNVYEAAAQEGIRRVASASSINWLGFYYGIQEWPIRYFPIDEEHPNYTSDVYSFSKTVTEEIAAYYWRREGISSTCLRMPAVLDPESNWFPRRKEWLAQTRITFDELSAKPAEERHAWLERLLQTYRELLASRWLEMTYEERQAKGWGMDNADVRFLGARNNFWTLLDARDAAQAFEKSLSADFEGCHPLFVNDDRNSSGVATESLLQMFFPKVTARSRPLVGVEALVSIERARQLIGFEPEHSFSQ